MKPILFVVLFIFSINALADRLVRKISVDGRKYELQYFSNASNKANGDSGAITTEYPLIIYTKANWAGHPDFLHCDKGFLQIGMGCYTCPTGFTRDLFASPDDIRKCHKNYTSIHSRDSIYTARMVNAFKKTVTPRQARCVFDQKNCYTESEGLLLGYRYGISCGFGYGLNDKSKIMDNLDKCCYAHDNHLWDDNAGAGANKQAKACSNDLNGMRCMAHVYDYHHASREEKNAAFEGLLMLSPYVARCQGAEQLAGFVPLAGILKASPQFSISQFFNVLDMESSVYPWNAPYQHFFESSYFTNNLHVTPYFRGE